MNLKNSCKLSKPLSFNNLNIFKSRHLFDVDINENCQATSIIVPLRNLNLKTNKLHSYITKKPVVGNDRKNMKKESSKNYNKVVIVVNLIASHFY